jgi:predicted AAA+ superfamily ATPase
MKRYLAEQVAKDLKKKMVFLGGPRQVGKTTLAQTLAPARAYLNWDAPEDRECILLGQLPATDMWIFDEIHKYKQWRNYLKGLYDKNKNTHKIMVTGSARLDLYRRGGDSLQGRYHFLRLHPITLDEIKSEKFSDLKHLYELGGFPEPFLSGEKFESQRWSREYRQRILRDDILSLERIEDLGSAEKLMLRLPDLVGSPLSINALVEDIQVNFKTLKRWIEIYERFYALYRIPPFGYSKIKAVKKEQKHYHFDWTLIKEAGPRFENLVANHLLKWCHYFEDTQGRDLELRFYKDQEQREVDFVVTENQKPILFLECKLKEKNVSPHLNYIKRKFPSVPAFQLSFEGDFDYVSEYGIRVGQAHRLFAEVKQIIAKG